MIPTSRLSLVLLSVAVAAACGGSSSPTTPTSTTSSTSSGSSSSVTSSSSASSHNAGADCTSCHNFTVAGTAYKAGGTTVYPGAVIRLTTAVGDNASAVLTVTADRSGNFYSGSSVAFGQGLYATATGTTVNSKNAAVGSGACNRCHTSGNRLIVN